MLAVTEGATPEAGKTSGARLSASGRATAPTGLARLLGQALNLVWKSGRRSASLLGVLTIVQAVATVVQLALAGRLVNEVQRLANGVGEFSDAVPELLAFGGAFAIHGAAGVWLNETRTVLGELTIRAAQAQITAAANRAPLIAFDRPSFHDLLTRALRAGASRPMQVTSSLATISTSLVLAVALTITLVFIEPVVLLVVLVGGVPTWLLTRRVTRLGYQFAIDETEPDRRRAYLLYLLTSREAAGEVRAFQLADHLDERHQRSWTERIARVRRVTNQRGVFGTAGRLVNAAVISGIVAVLVWSVAEGRASLGAAATAAGAVAILGQRLTSLLSGVGVLYECALFLSDVDAFSKLHPRDAAESASTTSPRSPDGPLRADAVSFTYPTGSTPAVRGASLEVSPGELVALVGENGSGKTTLAKLLAGLLEPDRGSVTWSDSPLCDGATSWHDDVAVVFQDFCRYRLPLRDNVSFGDVVRTPADDAVVDTLRRVGLADLPDTLAEGLDTGLGPEYAQSTDLSGGQWQRVAIARALFRDAPVVILDEPTAALDPRAESDLYAAIERLAEGRAVVMISHRLATVTRATRIHVLADGEITESGSHVELMGADGAYAEMFRLQSERFTTDR